MSETYRDPSAPCFPDLAGKVALVTGAGRNIGRAIAVRLAREGMRLVLTDRAGDGLAGTGDWIRRLGGESLEVSADIRSPEELDAVFAAGLERFGPLDVLVQNATLMRQLSFQNVTLEDWDNTFATNCRGGFLLAKKGYEQMRERGGAMIYISTVGALRNHQVSIPYDNSKAAMDSFVRSLALDLGREGIRVNAVAPGAVKTLPDDAETVTPPSTDRVPLGRSGTPFEIAAAVAFLASAQAAYVHGHVLYVDGGLVSQLTTRDRKI